jgi:hypothetical protein
MVGVAGAAIGTNMLRVLVSVYPEGNVEVSVRGYVVLPGNDDLGVAHTSKG